MNAKTAAHDRVAEAIARGKLRRPDRCESCGAEGEVHGHHDDYRRPLDVRWLCRLCHAAEHAEEPDWFEAARVLRAEGLTYRAIAEQLGVGPSAVYKRLNPGAARRYSRASNGRRRGVKREHERAQIQREDRRGRCTRCCGLMGAGVPDDGVCSACRERESAEQRQRLADLWAAGATVEAIAADLGLTVPALRTKIARIRARSPGAIPHRYRVAQK